MLANSRGNEVSLNTPVPLASNLVATRIHLIAIGVSTGGPNALEVLLRSLPANLPVPIVIVQHLPTGFTKMLVSRLKSAAKIPVSEATAGQRLEPGHAYLAPSDYHLMVMKSNNAWIAKLNQLPPENSCRPAVDVLFRSVAAEVGRHALALVMTGMGQDGLLGCQAIRKAHGQVIVQDQATSVVWGMPGAVAEARLANQILPLHQLGPEIIRLTSAKTVAIQPRGARVQQTAANNKIISSMDNDTFEFIRDLVKRKAAIVIDQSKRYLIESRLLPIARKNGCEGLNELKRRLKIEGWGSLHDQVVEALTTNETSFFRDIHPFDTLASQILPDLIARRSTRKSLRIWSAACSSGQEPYSIAMIIREFFPELANWDVRIFATDISNEVLEQAKSGIYRQAEVNRGISEIMIARHFDRKGELWQVKPTLRQLLQFGPLNLLDSWEKIPTMDIIFIRNVLIYFDAEVKQRIFEKLRGKISSDGFLLLGGAETPHSLSDRFSRRILGRTTIYCPIGQ